MFNVQQREGVWNINELRYPDFFLSYSWSLIVAGKMEDSNNLTWVDGYQNKNAYVMTNIYR